MTGKEKTLALRWYRCVVKVSTVWSTCNLHHLVLNSHVRNEVKTVNLLKGVTDTGNISVSLNIMDINTTAHLPWNKSQKWGCWAAYFCDNMKHPSQKCHAYFNHLPPIFHISWYLVHKHRLKSNHRSLLSTQQDFVKCCIKRWVHPNLWINKMLLVRNWSRLLGNVKSFFWFNAL